MKKFLCRILSVVCIAGMLTACSASQTTNTTETATTAETTETAEPETSDYTFQDISWTEMLETYRNDDSVNQLIFVECIGTSEKAVLMFFEKSQNSQGVNLFTKTVETDAYIGPNGLGKTKEGDYKTPEGTFDVITAFGNKDNPGTKLPYLEVNEDYYSCDEDCEYYNQIINVKETGHQCTGEHLSDLTPYYNYAMQLNYNPENTPGLGNSIFLHCTGGNRFTGGCIAIDEENMKYIVQHSEPGVKVLIYEMGDPADY